MATYATDRAITSARATSFGAATRSIPAPSLQTSSTNESKFANHREWERAEPLYPEALDIYKKAYGREHRDGATVLNNLGMLYHAHGLYAKAEPLYQEAPAIDTKVLPPNHTGGIATDHNSLGLLYFAATSLTPPPAAEAVDTKGWTIAIGLNEALSADKAFVDVGFAVETEKPLRFVVNGAVHADQDLPRLIEKIKELRPEGDYDIRVEVLRPQAP